MRDLGTWTEGQRATATQDFALGADKFARMVAMTEGVDTPLDQLEAAGVADLKRNQAALAQADLASLDHPAQLALARRISEWPRTVEIAARAHEPHRIAFFLYDLASDLHALWNRGNDETTLRFVQDGDIAATSAKIALARAVGVVISAGLGILGVTPAKEMR